MLKQIHDELDAAVFEAYGWPGSLTDEEILERLVALNAERAAEESRGLVRWLRPEFQNPPTKKQKTFLPANDEEEPPATKGKRKGAKPEKPPTTKPAKKSPWPRSLPEQVQAVRQQLLTSPQPVTADELAKQFLRGNSDRIDEVLQSLVITGNARALDDGERYVAA